MDNHTMRVPGLHHVTAIARDPQANVDFYCGVLGLLLVKQTVNFDDPGTYHLYYGDSHGTPGTILTFFPWGNTVEGRRGNGQPIAVSFQVGRNTLDYWEKHFAATGLAVAPPAMRFGDRLIAFNDPDDLRLEIVASGDGDQTIAGIHGITLSESGFDATATVLTELLGLEPAESEGNRYRYRSISEGNVGRFVEVLCQPDTRRGSLGTGTIHHVAFRSQNAEEQVAWQRILASAGQNVTPLLDRKYFQSIYFREPGGVLFEIATDPPGFGVDEHFQALGTELKLPGFLEPQRREIEAILPPLRVPGYSSEVSSVSQS